VYDCKGHRLGWGISGSRVGDGYCDSQLRCYCEEQETDCPTGGKAPAPVCSARWARCQHPHTGSGEPRLGWLGVFTDESLQAPLAILGMAGVLCGP